MGKKNDSADLVNSAYESSLSKAEENIKKGQLTLKEVKERKIYFKDVEFNVKNHMNEMTKLVKEAKLIKASTSSNIKEFYNSLIKCDELFDKLSTDDRNLRIEKMFSGIIEEINSKCKPVNL
ncbi:hypothetical protein MKS88_003841 [Plasmodium brasilianum]|uniref:Uncharacterized protein n=2 Tax=Plasmodium (Plasmodium) TaxID=418103 RepID=A0A1A8WQ70_PLAMA|nr:conserved Plasmodium protein, unknown function [Plasmodium malariae]KAI4837369.1 hypothetical protein MKS88_003841 [Plasmodium brasilianum]SBS94427.1 conserved Plasmodium protein, unknown function [Plasmodium malariae]SCO93254.1 conserved Plasmodium protein, unknown function [Plasmodium malariae]